ncbi:dTDP-4-dehydrorhamnose reductase [Mesonia algae]|uniref:dTDP-4-dehydrorhamnose reductase n=1 Tax=Mesonia algae TaxID=213248 RepID=A0A2W7IBX3_9FLAO|nr:dTDP-4-dehydrorhamnose reductase [Mesonia algae]PZW44204.1 dTDP-4-dehydrorhamnose reductase [Mesonia algae]
MNILVTGAAGQLGQCLQIAAKAYPNYHFNFKNSTDLDIASAEAIESIFSQKKYDFCINAAAYTNVEKAESKPERAFLINAEAVKNLAKTCKKYQTKLIHVSTDYVFDGEKEESYSEEDKVNPINVYGASKLKGEKYIQETLETFFIIRTSWLYSQFGHNFFKTILQKAKEGATLNITTEQKGNPTNANDLAALILKIIEKKSEAYGIYHFSNLEEATWYDFAKSIVSLQPHTKAVLHASNSYKTKAKRPLNSCLDKKKVISTFGVSILSWRNSLENLYQTYIK